MIITLQKVGREGTYLNIIKAIYDKPIANIILNGEKLKAFPVRSVTRQGCPLANFIQHSFGSHSHGNQRRKRNNWKRRSKSVTVCRCMTLYVENPKDASRKLLALINEFSKVAGYKINTLESVAFLYTSKE